MTGIDYLKGRSEAHDIHTRLTVAYYLDSAGDTPSADYHYSVAIGEFLHLAAALGYTVEKIDPDTSHMQHGWEQAMERVYGENIAWAKGALSSALQPTSGGEADV